MSNNRSLNLTILMAAIASLILVIAATNTGYVFARQKFTANLSGNNEVPPVNTNAGGEAKFTVINDNTTIKYRINITGLTDANGAHIHTGKEGKNGAVIVDLMKNSKKNDIATGIVIRGNITDSSLTGPIKGKTVADLISAMSNGDTYTNVHTPKHPKGEIRGRIAISETTGSNQTSSTSANETSNITP